VFQRFGFRWSLQDIKIYYYTILDCCGIDLSLGSSSSLLLPPPHEIFHCHVNIVIIVIVVCIPTQSCWLLCSWFLHCPSNRHHPRPRCCCRRHMKYSIVILMSSLSSLSALPHRIVDCRVNSFCIFVIKSSSFYCHVIIAVVVVVVYSATVDCCVHHSFVS